MLASQPRKGPVCNPCQADTTGLGSVAQRGSTAAPLVQRGDSMAGPCRGDCKARQMIQLGAVIGCGSTAWPSRHGTGSTAWVRRLAVNPSVGVRRQLPLHKGAVFAFLHRACQLHNKKLPQWGSFFAFGFVLLPSAGAAQCLGGHTFFAFLHRTCPAQERSMGAASRC